MSQIDELEAKLESREREREEISAVLETSMRERIYSLNGAHTRTHAHVHGGRVCGMLKRL